MENIAQHLPRLPYWGDLTDAERDAVARHAVVRHYRRAASSTAAAAPASG